MGSLILGVARLHNAVFAAIQYALEGWLLGLAARLAFSSTLLFFFWNSAFTKVVAPDWTQGGERVAQGPLDYLTVEAEAYAQMAPAAFQAAGADPSALGLPFHVMAYAGSYAEFLLPLLILVGLFTRLASISMIGFIAVMTWVDVTRPGGEPFELSRLFDNSPYDIIVDQRLMWIFPLVYLVVRGAGAVSIDYLFTRNR